MAVLESIFALISFSNSLIGEAWTRYFILLAGLTADSTIGALVGIYPLEGLLGFVIATVFGVKGFLFPVYYGVSSLLILAAIMPFAMYLLKIAAFDIEG